MTQTHLSHGNERQLSVLHCVVDIASICLDLLAGGVAREKDEENWGAGGCLAHDNRGAEGILVDIAAAHGLLTKVLAGTQYWSAAFQVCLITSASTDEALQDGAYVLMFS